MAVSEKEVREAILEILSEIVERSDLDELQDDVPFSDQFELDSMDMLDVPLGLRKRFELPIPDSDYPQLQTMNSTVAYILSNLNAKS